jgi:uncharacterized phage-associated protein
MASARDVASYILECQGEMSTWKLQKLLYYSQAWHLAWDDEPIFPERIEAWANGPVVRDVYNTHRQWFSISPTYWSRGDSSQLTESERATVDLVLVGYGDLTGRQLSHLTHNERPWQEAREGLAPTDRSEREISIATMHEFYSALDAADEARPVEEIDWDDLGLR